jgi:hypothetical protein
VLPSRPRGRLLALLLLAVEHRDGAHHSCSFKTKNLPPGQVLFAVLRAAAKTNHPETGFGLRFFAFLMIWANAMLSPAAANVSREYGMHPLHSNGHPA